LSSIEAALKEAGRRSHSVRLSDSSFDNNKRRDVGSVPGINGATPRERSAPLSFQDTNGDGKGDLNGIERRIDYLEWLGKGLALKTNVNGSEAKSRTVFLVSPKLRDSRSRIWGQVSQLKCPICAIVVGTGHAAEG